MGRSWRLAATGLLFAVFGIGGILAGVIVFPLIACSSRDPLIVRRRARSFIGASFRAFLWLMKSLGVARFDIEPSEWKELSAERGVLVVANHPTLIDVVFMIAYIDQVSCVVKATLWRNPFLRWGVRSAAYIPNDDLEAMMNACEQALRKGESLIIFPEATRTVPGRPMILQRGAANVALRADATLRIVHIRCEPWALSKTQPWYRIPRSQPCFSLKVGGSLCARDSLLPGERLGVAARRLTGVLQMELSKEDQTNESIGR